MKKLSVLFLSLVALTATVTSCSKDSTTSTPAATVLELTIKNSVGTAVPNATVKLYDDAKSTNLIATGTSDSTGKVTFNKDLKTIVYYYDVAADCQTNQFSADYTTGAALVANTTTKKDVALVSTGTVTVTNASQTDSYNLYVTIASNPEQKLGAVSATKGGPLALPTGIANVLRAVKLNADGTESTVPADTVTKTVNLATCGATDAFTFPQS